MTDYPRLVAMGPLETMTIHGPEEHDGAVRLVVDNELRPGARVPMHAHHFQEEAITVVSGRIGYRVAGEPARSAGPGETVVFGPGEYHGFWAEGDETLRVRGYIEPPAAMRTARGSGRRSGTVGAGRRRWARSTRRWPDWRRRAT